MSKTINVYVVRSHNKNSQPDGRELCFTGSPAEADRFYHSLTHADRFNDRYLFGTSEDDAVGYREWEYAGLS